MNEMVARFKDWLHAPFQQNMDIFHVFLLTGLVIIAALAWKKILSELRQASATILE